MWSQSDGFTVGVAEAMKDVGFIELHFEYEPEGGALNRDAYKQVRSLSTRQLTSSRPTTDWICLYRIAER